MVVGLGPQLLAALARRSEGLSVYPDDAHGSVALPSTPAAVAGAIVDALSGFTRSTTGAWFWCPPMHDGRPDLRSIN